MEREIEKFKYFYDGQVKFNEVDSFGVVHNIQYLYYLEWARIKYLEKVGYPISADTFSKDNLLMVVHQDIDYYSPMRFFENFRVYTRTKKIGNSSISIENIVITENKEIAVKANVVMVYVDSNTKKSATLPKEIVDKINKFEK